MSASCQIFVTRARCQCLHCAALCALVFVHRLVCSLSTCSRARLAVSHTVPTSIKHISGFFPGSRVYRFCETPRAPTRVARLALTLDEGFWPVVKTGRFHLHKLACCSPRLACGFFSFGSLPAVAVACLCLAVRRLFARPFAWLARLERALFSSSCHEARLSVSRWSESSSASCLGKYFGLLPMRRAA